MNDPMHNEISDKLLIERIQHGSPDEQAAAAQALHGRYEALVHGYVVGHVPLADIADVEQDAWKEVISSALKVELKLENAKGWVMRIVHRAVAAYYEKPTPVKQPLDEAIESQPQIAEVVEQRETLLEGLNAWRALTPEQRLVVFLADIAEVPVSEIIRWVGRSRQAIYEMHRRAREAIRSSTEVIQQGGEPESEWLEPFGHTNMVIDLHPVLSEEEQELLANATGVEPDRLMDDFEFGMTLFVEPTEEYLEELGRRPGLFHLALLSREGLEEYLEGTGEGCDIYLFEMTLEGNRLTIDPRSRPFKTRTGWRVSPSDESPE